MQIVENKAANAINQIKARRYRLTDIRDWLKERYEVTTSTSSLSRIAYGERKASAELEKALIGASKTMR